MSARTDRRMPLSWGRWMTNDKAPDDPTGELVGKSWWPHCQQNTAPRECSAPQFGQAISSVTTAAA